jgi:hypothetical protein
LNATVIPNWNVVLTATGTAPSSESLRLLTGLHFSMLVDATGETTVKHSADTPAPNPTVQGGYDQIFSGMDQMITGFYQTYTPYMMTSPFPSEDSVMTVDPTDVGYRVQWKESNSATAVIVRLTRTFAMVDMTVNAKDFDAVIRPTFETTVDGYVLNAYKGSYESKTGPKNLTLVDARIEHTVVDGIRVPSLLFFAASVNGDATKTELKFTNHFITKRSGH